MNTIKHILREWRGVHMKSNLKFVVGILLGVLMTSSYMKIKNEGKGKIIEKDELENDLKSETLGFEERNEKEYRPMEIAQILKIHNDQLSPIANELERIGYKIKRANDYNKTRIYKENDIEVLKKFISIYEKGKITRKEAAELLKKTLFS